MMTTNNKKSSSPKQVLIRGGWSTSICDLFRNPYQRENCCAFACFGILLNDRNAHFMLNEARPSWTKRLGVNIGLPVVVLLILNICYNFLADTPDKKDYWQIAIFYAILFLVTFLLWRAKAERVKVRKEVMRRIYEKRFASSSSSQEVEHIDSPALSSLSSSSDDNRNATRIAADALSLDQNDEVNVQAYLRTHWYDIDVAHSTFAFYPDDVIMVDAATGQLDEDEQLEGKTDLSLQLEKVHIGDMCTCLFQVFSDTFFGFCCGCWVQCCGMCAIGQEAREIETLFDKIILQVDYITFQPYSDYYPRILQLRQQRNLSLFAHWKAISILSYNLLKIVITCCVILSIIALLELRPNFKLENLIVVFATFMQAILVLLFVHWFENRLDISVDAVIKYFASGFCLCTFIAIVYEMIVSMIFGTISQLVIAIGVYDRVDEYMTEDEINFEMLVWTETHVSVMVIFVFLNAFVVAGLIEELAKYFGYFMVETPDVMDPRDIAFLQKKRKAKMEQEEGQQQILLQGQGKRRRLKEQEIIEKVMSISKVESLTEEEMVAEAIAISKAEAESESESESEEEMVAKAIAISKAEAEAEKANVATVKTEIGNNENNQDDNSGKNRGENSDNCSNSNNSNNSATTNTTKNKGNNKKTSIYDATDTPPNLTSRAAGITVAMVAVAAGFACCENLLYVFIYTDPGLFNQINTLLVRSLFPVHPLCAAIQSIGVVNRDVLGDERSQLGRILLPALLIHGGFDFVLMVMSLMDEMNEQQQTINQRQQNMPKETDDLFGYRQSQDDYWEYDRSTAWNNDEVAEYSNNDEISLYVSVGIVVLGIFYFGCLADRQLEHLQELDESLAVAAAGGTIAEKDKNNNNNIKNCDNTNNKARDPLGQKSPQLFEII